mmetsp:Transcript_98614/g.264947  ORF Transcript_98614/g.264947 Transcript_98614/m.264947 type:complete len:237 (-) Transcript_98614:3-713(-)
MYIGRGSSTSAAARVRESRRRHLYAACPEDRSLQPEVAVARVEDLVCLDVLLFAAKITHETAHELILDTHGSCNPLRALSTLHLPTRVVEAARENRAFLAVLDSAPLHWQVQMRASPGHRKKLTLHLGDNDRPIRAVDDLAVALLGRIDHADRRHAAGHQASQATTAQSGSASSPAPGGGCEGGARCLRGKASQRPEGCDGGHRGQQRRPRLRPWRRHDFDLPRPTPGRPTARGLV